MMMTMYNLSQITVNHRMLMSSQKLGSCFLVDWDQGLEVLLLVLRKTVKVDTGHSVNDLSMLDFVNSFEDSSAASKPQMSD